MYKSNSVSSQNLSSGVRLGIGAGQSVRQAQSRIGMMV